MWYDIDTRTEIPTEVELLVKEHKSGRISRRDFVVSAGALLGGRAFSGVALESSSSASLTRAAQNTGTPMPLATTTHFLSRLAV